MTPLPGQSALFATALKSALFVLTIASAIGGVGGLSCHHYEEAAGIYDFDRKDCTGRGQCCRAWNPSGAEADTKNWYLNCGVCEAESEFKKDATQRDGYWCKTAKQGGLECACFERYCNTKLPGAGEGG